MAAGLAAVTAAMLAGVAARPVVWVKACEKITWRPNVTMLMEENGSKISNFAAMFFDSLV